MPVISIVNSKGGSGKSTSALVLGTTLAQHGASVAILDGDPNQPIRTWRTGESKTAAAIIPNMNESKIVQVIDSEKTQRQFVIVDLEGTASRMVSRAIARSDLVLIPMQPSALDATEAARALALVKEEEEVFNRRIPHRVLFTRTSPQVKTRNERMILAELLRYEVPLLNTQLCQRTAYQALFSYKLALDELDPDQVNGLDKAQGNAFELASEVVETVAQLSN
jgi:chromosome partitioning protein